MKKRHLTSSSSPSSLQQRQPPSSSKSPPVVVEPMDESDQEKVIQQFQRELRSQQEQIHSLLETVIVGVMGVSIVVTLYTILFYNTDDQEENSMTSTTSFASRRFSQVVLILHGLLGSPALHFYTLWKQNYLREQFSKSSSFAYKLFSFVQPLLWGANHPNNNNEKIHMNHASIIFLLTILNVGCPLVSYSVHNGQSLFLFPHGGLMVSNLGTMLFALVLHWDYQSTNQSIQQLEKSRYHFKSL